MKNERNAADVALLNATRGLVEGLHRQGAISDEELRPFAERRASAHAEPLGSGGARTFDASALTPELPPERIRALREREGASQAVFARYLGVATATLSQWERGVRRPEGPALRLMGLAERHGLEHIR